MKPTPSHLFRTTLLIGVALISTTTAPAADVKEKIQLLPAKDLSACYTFVKDLGVDKDPNHVFTLTNGMVRIAGTARGYLATKAEYSNYRLVAEYRWGKEATNNDSGIFVHCVGPDKDWMQSLEIQVATTPKTHSGDIILIGGQATKLTVTGTPRQGNRFPRTGEINYEKPIGEWNTMEVTCDGGRVEVKVNGRVTNIGTDASPRAGKIFLQSNQNEIFFRRWELHPLK